jgi:hypothetical protein
VARGNPLLPQFRSRNHEWLLRAAQVGGAVVVGVGVPGGALLAATHPEYHSTAWTIALVVVVALAVIGIAALLVGGVGAFLTRPVPPEHADTLRASALAVSRALESDRVCEYGDDPAKQAFCAHFPKLARRLAVWDELVSAPTKLQGSFEHDINAQMAGHGIEAPTFDVNTISAYMRAFLEMSAAHGDAVVQPSFQWSGFSTAGHPEIPGPPFGVLLPYPGSANWIILTPLDGESESEWQARADPLIEKADAFAEAAHASVPEYVLALNDAKQRLNEFTEHDLPTILDALRLVQAREAPRVRHGCDVC